MLADRNISIVDKNQGPRQVARAAVQPLPKGLVACLGDSSLVHGIRDRLPTSAPGTGRPVAVAEAELAAAAAWAGVIRATTRVLGSQPRHHVGWRALLPQELRHFLHRRSRVPEEQLEPRAQVVLAGLAVARGKSGPSGNRRCKAAERRSHGTARSACRACPRRTCAAQAKPRARACGSRGCCRA